MVVLDQAERVLLLNLAAAESLDVDEEATRGLHVGSIGVPDLVAALTADRTAGAPIVHEIAAPNDRAMYASVSPVHDVG